MKRILNPWADLEGYNCIACAPDNAHSLKMEFFEDGDEIISLWTPTHNHQGWINTLHGGIQATILDEICAWAVIRKLQTSGVTSKMEVKYLKAVSTQDNTLTLRAKITEQRRNITIIEASITDSNGTICTTAVCTYFCVPADKFKQDTGFKGCFTEDEII